MHPSCVIPPIPKKQSMADYASKLGKIVDDPPIIQKRMRLLGFFLERLIGHAVFRRNHLVHLFITCTIGKYILSHQLTLTIITSLSPLPLYYSHYNYIHITFLRISCCNLSDTSFIHMLCCNLPDLWNHTTNFDSSLFET